MSKNITPTSKQQAKKTGREFLRTHNMRLPTPPPDPTQPSKITDSAEHNAEVHAINRATIDKENEFLDYLNSLPLPTKCQSGDKPGLQRTGSVFAPAMAAEDAFDHLDKLYKLMEQLLNLREQNAKLHRRVRDLEHMKNVQNMQQLVATNMLIGDEADIPELDDDSVLAEALLDNMFPSGQNKRSTKQKPPPQFRFRQSLLRPQRDRSCSLAVDDLSKGNLEEGDRNLPEIPRICSGKSLTENCMVRKPSKVSKWTKVKAAFKWEKASPTVTGAKSQDSGIGGMLPVNNEVARYLRVPSTSDNPNESGTSPADSVLSGSWQGPLGLSTPGTLSPASSTDELHPSTNSEHRSVSRTGSAGHSNASGKRFGASLISDDEDGSRRSRSLDYSSSYPCDSVNSIISKDDLLKLQASKSHKTPWGKVKDIIHTRKDSLKKKQYRLSARSDECRIDWSAGSDQEDVFEPAHATINTEELRAPTVTVTTSDDIVSPPIAEAEDDCSIPADVLARYQRVAAEEHKSQSKQCTGSPRSQRRVSKWTKVKKAFLTSASVSRTDDESRSDPSSPTRKSYFFSDKANINFKNSESTEKVQKKSEDDIETRKLKEEIYRNYEQLQQKLSIEFQDKLQEWEKVKSYNSSPTSGSFPTAPGTNSCCPAAEDQYDPEFARKMEEWERIKHQNCSDNSKRRNLQMTSEENLPADFRKKLQEWQKIKKLGGKEEEAVLNSRKKKADWQLWRSNSTQKQDQIPCLGQPDGRQFSEDFLKKLDEWKQIKASHNTNEENDHRKSIKESKTPSPGLSRKSSSKTRQTKKHKMQEWLEKELQKIEREKQRLEREREKFLEREERLAKLRRSIGNGPHKKDVLVQTSTGFYRFEGISRKFTQRLYEWEKARGIGPEASTFALLSSAYKQIFPYPARTVKGNPYRHDKMSGGKLMRSKSMDSVANLTCVGSVITHQPSSLSLNDMEELEIECLADSPSEQNRNESEDNLDFGEPEAVIVEIEDFIEETAAPLESRVQENRPHTPVYQTEVTNLCESERCESPQVRRSESIKALKNYNLIQECLNILDGLKVNEETCKTTETKLNNLIKMNEAKERQLDNTKHTGAIPKRCARNSEQSERQQSVLQVSLNRSYGQQAEISQSLLTKLLLLHDANITISKTAAHENTGYTISHVADTTSQIQDLSAELVSNAEKLKNVLTERNTDFGSSHKEIREGASKKYAQYIHELVNSLILKIKELKRSLSYFYAASDMTAPGRRRKSSHKERKHMLHKRASLDQITISNDKTVENTSDEEEQNNKTISPRRKEKLVKSKSEDNHLINYAKLQVTSVGDNRKERAERSYQLKYPPTSLVKAHVSNDDITIKEDNHSTDQSDLRRQNKTQESTTNTAEALRKNRNQRKLLRTRRVSDSYNETKQESNETQINTESTGDKPEQKKLYCKSYSATGTNVIIPTSIHYLDVTSNNAIIQENISVSPVSIFVQTTRKLFTPFVSEIVNQNEKSETSADTIRECSTSSSPTKQCEVVSSTENEKHKNNFLRRSHSPSDSPLLPRKRRMTMEITTDEKPVKSTSTDEQTDQNSNEINDVRTPTSSTYQLPPLPISPVSQKRERMIKETSPAIRMMVARYNQKLSEQENSGTKSGGSSGSASPVAWRSPVFERRVRAQTERYQDEVNKALQNCTKYSPHFTRKQVQKSASVAVMHPANKQFTTPHISERGISLDSGNNTSPNLIRGILKSTSMDCMKDKNPISESSVLTPLRPTENVKAVSSKFMEKAASLKLSISPPRPECFKTSPVLQERAHKLQKAKEEFLSQTSETSSAGPLSAPPVFKARQESVKYPVRNRLSQVSVGSESSCDDSVKYSGLLVKSASAGMINIDEATYQQFKPEIHSQGYVSLPRSTKKKDGKFGISSIASKFRKVKMRRSKDPAQMNTVSTLCRQSLIVDICGENQENVSENESIKKRNSREQDVPIDVNTPLTSKINWIKNPTKIFKPKQ